MDSYSPKVWTRFERSVNGCVKKFKVQDVPVEFYDKVVNFMALNYLPEAPICVATDTINNPEELATIKTHWKENVLPQNLSLVCLEDSDVADSEKEIVGVNYLIRNSKEKQEKKKEVKLTKLLMILKEINSRFNIFEEYGVSEYLDALGLCVNKNYRGMNIASELLLARSPLAKEKGFKVTETIFTVMAAQISAKKSGFTTLIEIEFADLGKQFDIKFPSRFKTLKIMTKTFE